MLRVCLSLRPKQQSDRRECRLVTSCWLSVLNWSTRSVHCSTLFFSPVTWCVSSCTCFWYWSVEWSYICLRSTVVCLASVTDDFCASTLSQYSSSIFDSMWSRTPMRASLDWSFLHIAILMCFNNRMKFCLSDLIASFCLNIKSRWS